MRRWSQVVLSGVLVAGVVLIVSLAAVSTSAWADSMSCASTTTTTAPQDPNAPCDAVEQVYSATDTLGPGLVALAAGPVTLVLCMFGGRYVMRRLRGRGVL